jgi:hypothetical protein
VKVLASIGEFKWHVVGTRFLKTAARVLNEIQTPTGPYPGYNMEMSTGLVTKPGVCPFCLWDLSLPADERINQ